MIQQLIPELERGALVLTANRRLARSLSRAYDEAQRTSGAKAWPAPRILPLGTWLVACHEEGTLAGAVSAAVLSPLREASLWEAIILESPSGADLLQPREAAREAAEGWALAKQYGVALRAGTFQGHPDSAVFLEWALAFERKCGEANVFGAALLPDMVSECVRAGAVVPPRRVLLSGFDELTPQQQDLLATLSRAGCEWQRVEVEAGVPGEVGRALCVTSDDEYRAAARWARSLMEQRQTARIAVVVPGLSSARNRVERIFAEELSPGVLASTSPNGIPFHISAGRSLADLPVVRAALLVLSLGHGRIPIGDAGALLRSPYIAGAQQHAAKRADAFNKIRGDRRRSVSESELRRHLPEVAEPFDRVWRTIPDALTVAEWREAFVRLLDAGGWPGDTPLGSAEFQVRDAFVRLLDAYAGSVWDAAQTVSFATARERLARLAKEAEFATEDEGAPVQVMGVMEAAGSHFDALWVTGLHDGAWPQPAHPNPFLPVRVQQEHNMPHCSAAREGEFARTVTRRLCAAAPQVVLSWPATEGDAELRPSALLPDAPDIAVAGPADGWTALLKTRAEMDALRDDVGPPLEAAEAAGGTKILKLQASCPFRAFAELRLGARPPESPDPGIGPMERGNIVHKALEMFWRRVGSHAELCASEPEKLCEIARGSVEAAFGSRHSGTRLRGIEIERLTALILDWLDVERRRAPFRVVEREKDRVAEVAGLKIKGCIDRVDELEDGTQAIIDYKATAPPVNSWGGDRPAEPQLPFYAVTHEADVGAVLFANLRPENLRFVGVADKAGIVPQVKAEADLEGHIAEWRRTLERLAREYAEGHAEVDPIRQGACDRCPMAALCRVAEAGGLGDAADL